ncbi:MAG: uridine kinase [Marinilabiliales bacterium]|nr:MAG: uridine kinase [Marinilabiliales bacterium]
MLGDVLLIADKHRSAAKEIVSEILKIAKPKIIICVSGESGSGKTELSHCIGKELVKNHNIPTKIIHSDNYYSTHPKIRNKWRLENGLDKVGINEIDWKNLIKNVHDFLENKISQMPCVDLVPDEVDMLTTDFSKIKILIVDGLYAINLPSDLSIYIDLTYHETKKAQADRGKEKSDELRWQILEQEHKNVISLKEKANIIINKDYSVTWKK